MSKDFPESRNIAPTKASNTSANAFGAVESAHSFISYINESNIHSIRKNSMVLY